MQQQLNALAMKCNISARAAGPLCLPYVASTATSVDIVVTHTPK